MDIKGKVVIVTGASSGIGEATARQFGRQGARVVLAARRVDKLESLAQEITSMGTGAEALVVQADLSKLEDIQSLITQTIEKFGRIDVLVNNAWGGYEQHDYRKLLPRCTSSRCATGMECSLPACAPPWLPVVLPFR